MRPLTPRQAEVLRTLFDLVATQGYPPTVRELADALGIFPFGAQRHLLALQRKQAIQRGKGPRAIKLLVRG